MTYRQPTRSDIGKMVEVSNTGEKWRTRILCKICLDYVECLTPAMLDQGCAMWSYCRVPVTTSADELLFAADMLEENGMEYAASVLRNAGELLQKNDADIERLTTRQHNDPSRAIATGG